MGRISSQEFFEVGYGKVSVSESDRMAWEVKVGGGDRVAPNRNAKYDPKFAKQEGYVKTNH